MRSLLLILALACSANAGQASSSTRSPGGLLWHLNEGTGSNHVDSIQGANFSGITAPWVTGRWGSGLSFVDGAEGGQTYGSFPKTIYQGTHWVHLWVKTTQAYSNRAGNEASGYTTLISFWSNNSGTSVAHLGMNGGGCGKYVAHVLEYAGSWGSVHCGATVLNDGRWHQVDKVRTSDDVVRLYVDGRLDGTFSTGRNATGTCVNFNFVNWLGQLLTFTMDELFISTSTNDALMPTSGDIQRLYTEGLGRHSNAR